MESLKIRLLIFLLCAFALPAFTGASEADYDTGMPFGPVGEPQVNALVQFSKTQGLDLVSELSRAYKRDRKALATVFRFSLKFDRLDDHAKTYGHLIYCAFFYFGESPDGHVFWDVLAEQKPEVQQRIRDFLFYDVTQAPKKIRKKAEKAARKTCPMLFPKDYVFGRDNPIFGKPNIKRITR